MKQKIMLRVLYALVPILVSGIYFFGWRVVAVLAACNAAGILTEYVTTRQRGQSVSTACLVTCWLFALALPPTVPFWIAAVGVVVGILFGKEVFGGFGRNVVNPAILGRAFVYVCFPTELTARFVPVFRGFPGGFAHWSFESLGRLPQYLTSAANFPSGATRAADAVSQASPMWVSREYGVEVASKAASWLDLLLGNIGGVFVAGGEGRILSAGSIGEGCAVLIALAAVYLLATRTANWRIVLGGLAGLAAASVLFRNLLGFGGLGEVPPFHRNLLAGTTMYVLVFMFTDPISAPKRRQAMFAYGGMMGFLTVFLRWRNVFVASASFAIILGNITAPLLDLAAGAWERRKHARKAPPKGGKA
jgi:Na+-transporting NADH:ubiquinone oxidoreductase subunit B